VNLTLTLTLTLTPTPNPNPTQKVLEKIVKLTTDYNQRVQEEEGKTEEEVAVQNVGKVDPKRHLQADVQELMSDNILQALGTMLDAVVF